MIPETDEDGRAEWLFVHTADDADGTVDEAGIKLRDAAVADFGRNIIYRIDMESAVDLPDVLNRVSLKVYPTVSSDWPESVALERSMRAHKKTTCGDR